MKDWPADKDLVCFPCLMFDSCSTENYKKCIGDRPYAGYEPITLYEDDYMDTGSEQGCE